MRRRGGQQGLEITKGVLADDLRVPVREDRADIVVAVGVNVEMVMPKIDDHLIQLALRPDHPRQRRRSSLLGWCARDLVFFTVALRHVAPVLAPHLLERLTQAIKRFQAPVAIAIINLLGAELLFNPRPQLFL